MTEINRNRNKKNEVNRLHFYIWLRGRDLNLVTFGL